MYVILLDNLITIMSRPCNINEEKKQKDVHNCVLYLSLKKGKGKNSESYQTYVSTNFMI